MEERFGSNPVDILAGIGPSIGPCCFEVGEEVAERFERAFPDGGAGLILRKDAPGGPKAHVDLWRANAKQLAGAGLPESNIETSGMCTSCRNDLFYSHRRESPAGGGRSGRFAAVILLNGRTRRTY
jgi:copper oxidase (laccase) domain-containing protein